MWDICCSCTCVENYDVTSLVTSHSDYCLAVNDILELVKYGQPRLSVNIDNITKLYQVDNETDNESIFSDEEGTCTF